MYNTSLKYKWDNKNVRDYEVSKGREEERAKADEEKREIAIKLALDMLTDNEPIEKIIKYTKLTLKEIESINEV
ncbi:hypothetical protein D3C87_1601880 [compost metagenome]